MCNHKCRNILWRDMRRCVDAEYNRYPIFWRNNEMTMRLLTTSTTATTVQLHPYCQ